MRQAPAHTATPQRNVLRWNDAAETYRCARPLRTLPVTPDISGTGCDGQSILICRRRVLVQTSGCCIADPVSTFPRRMERRPPTTELAMSGDGAI